MTNPDPLNPIDPLVPPTPPPPPPPPVSPDDGRLWFKEIVTATLALLVFIALAWAYCRLGQMPDIDSYATVRNSEERERLMTTNTSNMEKVATALFGIFAAFVGYYAGRVPAEKAASDANANANAAQQTAYVAQAQAIDTQARADDMSDRLRQEQTWADGAADLLSRASQALDSSPANSNAAAASSQSSLAAEAARHLQRRRRSG